MQQKALPKNCAPGTGAIYLCWVSRVLIVLSGLTSYFRSCVSGAGDDYSSPRRLEIYYRLTHLLHLNIHKDTGAPNCDILLEPLHLRTTQLPTFPLVLRLKYSKTHRITDPFSLQQLSQINNILCFPIICTFYWNLFKIVHKKFSLIV